MTSVVRFTREVRSQGMPQEHLAATDSCAIHTNMAIKVISRINATLPRLYFTVTFQVHSHKSRVVPLTLSPSSEMRKKPARKIGRARAGSEKHLFPPASRPQDLARHFFSRGFLSRLARRTKRKRDYS